MANNPPFCVVIWDDAWGDAVQSATPQDAHEKHMPTVMETRGWVLVDDPKGVSVFTERCLDKDEEYYRGRSFIPRAMIRSVTQMNLTTPRRRHKNEEAPPSDPSPRS